MDYGASFHVNVEPMAEITRLSEYYQHDPEAYPLGYIPIDAIYAPVSGSLLLGVASGDVDVLQHLKATYSVKFKGYRDAVYELPELLQTATIYRLMGHAVVYYDAVTQEEKIPWAPVNTCIPEPASIMFDPKKIEKLTIGESIAREGRTHPMPPLAYLAREGEIRISITRPTLEPVKYRSAQQPLKIYVRNNRVKKPITLKVKGRSTVRPDTFRATNSRHAANPDFRTEKTSISVDNPEGVKVTPKKTPALTGSDIKAASNADSNTVQPQSQDTTGGSSNAQQKPSETEKILPSTEKSATPAVATTTLPGTASGSSSLTPEKLLSTATSSSEPSKIQK